MVTCVNCWIKQCAVNLLYAIRIRLNVKHSSKKQQKDYNEFKMQKRESGPSIDTFLHKIISLMGGRFCPPANMFQLPYYWVEPN